MKLSKIIIILFLLFIYTSICAYSYAQTISNDISNNIFRLHIIANSNSEEDQNLKYKIRDNIISYMNLICKDCKTKNDALIIAKENIDIFKKIALDTIKENGFNYNVSVELGTFDFPTKDYGTISIPSGTYDALRIKIENAEGQNWWCVMFPSLCFIEPTSATFEPESSELLQDNMSNETFNVITKTSKPELKLKFKLIELFSANNIFSAKK